MHELSFMYIYSCFFGEMPICFCFDALKLLLVKSSVSLYLKFYTNSGTVLLYIMHQKTNGFTQQHCISLT